jgi:succinyl-diaminopimelate desuccinylase
MSVTNGTIQKVTGDIDRDAQIIQDFLVQMLRINAVNPRMGGPGEEERARFLESFLSKEGFSVSRFDIKDTEMGKTRPNLLAKIEGTKPKNLWIIAHMDTVPEGNRELWQTDPFVPTVKDGKIIARGAEDNGQALVSCLFALRELKRLAVPLPFTVGVWLVADEEFGSNYGIKHLLSQGLFKKDDLVIVPDAGTSSGAEIEITEKGMLWLKVTTKGKQVHASLPSKGLNAHRIGMKLAIDLDEMFHNKYDEEDPLFGERRSTFEPTKIEPDVANVNTIPGMDTFYFDCRVLPVYKLEDVVADAKAKIYEYENKYGVSISLELIQNESSGQATSEKSEVSVLVANTIRQMTRTQPKFVGVGGQTVGNLFRREGIPTVVWSTIDEVPHEPNEYCRIKNLISDTKVFAAIPLLA